MYLKRNLKLGIGIFLMLYSSVFYAQTFRVKLSQISNDGINWVDNTNTPVIKSITYVKGGNLGYEWMNGKYYELEANKFQLTQKPNDIIEIIFSPTGDNNSEFTLSDQSGAIVGAGFIKSDKEKYFFKFKFY
jgi:hypothetical protein